MPARHPSDLPGCGTGGGSTKALPQVCRRPLGSEVPQQGGGGIFVSQAMGSAPPGLVSLYDAAITLHPWEQTRETTHPSS